MLESGKYSISIQVDGQTYYIGRSQDNSDALTVRLPENDNADPLAFDLENVRGTDKYNILIGGQLVNERVDGKLYIGGNAHEQWKLVPLDNEEYMIKGGPEEGYCWTLASFVQQNSRAPTCSECPKTCACSKKKPCDKKNKGCPCGKASATVDTSLLRTTGPSLAGELVLRTNCSGCPSPCAIVTIQPA